MKKADLIELERLLDLIPSTIDEIIEKTKFNFKNDNLEKLNDASKIASVKSARVFFLSKALSNYFVLNGIKDNNVQMILNGCAIEGRLMLLSNKFYLHFSEPTVFVWDLLKSLLSSDTLCVQKYFELMPNSPRALYEVRGLTNTIREVINKTENNADSTCKEIFIKKSSNKFCESSLKLMRTIVQKDRKAFEQDCIELLKNYRRWAVSNRMYGETFIPLKALGLIKFGLDYGNFDLPNLRSIKDYAISDLTIPLTTKTQFPIFDSIFTNKWAMFEELNTLENIKNIDLR